MLPAWSFDGRFSRSKARLLTRVATPENEAELSGIAERTPTGRLATEIARWLGGQETPEVTERRLHEARSLRWRTDPDGMVVATLRIPPEVAAMPMAAIDARDHAPPHLHRRIQHREWHSRVHGRVHTTWGDVMGLGGPAASRCAGLAAASGRGPGRRRGRAARPWRRLHPRGRHPDRRRHPTTRQERAVHERDRGRVDCGATSLLEVDHDPGFALTGRTVVDELRERC